MPIGVTFTADARPLDEGASRAAESIDRATIRMSNDFARMAQASLQHSRQMSQGIADFERSFTASFKKVGESLKEQSGLLDYLARDFTTSTMEMIADLVRLRESGRTAWQDIKDSVGAVMHPIDTVKGAAERLTFQMGTALRDAAANLGRDFINHATALAEMNRRTGISVSTLQDLQGASKASGAEMQTLINVVSNFSAPGEQVKATLEGMGIALTDADGQAKSWRATLGEVADKFASYKDGADKAKLANDLFGSSEDKLIALLNQGGKSATAYFDEFERAGTKMSEADAKRAEQLQSTRRLEVAAEELARRDIGQVWSTYASDINATLKSDMDQWDKWKNYLGGLWSAISGSAEESARRIKNAAAGMVPSWLQGQASGVGPRTGGPYIVAPGNEGFPFTGRPAPSQQVTPPQILSEKDFDTTLAAIKNKQENWYSWSADKDLEFRKTSYEWAVQYYGRESELAKQLWAKYADAARAAHKPAAGGGGGGAAPAPDLMGEWNAELQKIKDAEENLYSWSKQQEIAFWQTKIGLAQQGSAEEQAVWHNIQNLRRQIANEELQEERQVRSVQLESARRHADVIMNTEENIIRFKREMNQITMAQEAAMLRESVERNYQAALQIEQNKLMVANLTKVEIERINKEIERLGEQHNQRLIADQNRVTLEIKRKWDSIAQSISSSISQSVMGLINGTQSMRQAIAGVLDQMLAKFIQSTAKMVIMSLWGEQQQTAAKAAGVAARTGIAEAGQAAGLAISFSGNLKEIFADAKVAAANTYKSVSSIPVIGWILAPLAAGAAFAAVMAFGSGMPSAAGGWDVDRDALAMVHQKEMVLPANLAEKVRGMSDAGGAGGSGELHLHVHAMDSREVSRALRNPSSGLSQAIQEHYRDFRLRPAT